MSFSDLAWLNIIGIAIIAGVVIAALIWLLLWYIGRR